MNSDGDRLRSLVTSAVTAVEPSPAELDALWASIAERAGAAGAQPAGRHRPWRSPRRLATLAVVTAVTLAAVIVPLSVRAAGPRRLPPASAGAPFDSSPLVDTALTPPGWSPVALGDAQISVPASWLLQRRDETQCLGRGRHVGGWVFVGERATSLTCGPGGSSRPENVVSMVKAAHPVAESGPSPRARWAFGVEVTASGPLAAKVLDTLTRSPLSVVLSRRDVAAPASWRTISFGGVTLSAPPEWRELHRDYWLGCPPTLLRATVLLDTASVNASGFSCPGYPATAGDEAAVPGLTIAAGRYVARPKPSARCWSARGLGVCVEPSADQSAVLTLSVGVPGVAHPVVIELGLAGSGAVPRAILDSLRPTRPAKTLAEPACRPSQLSLALGTYGVAAGSFSETLVFTDASPAPCVLSGWPRVDVSGPAARRARIVLVTDSPPGSPTSTPVTLEPGGAASIALYGADWNAWANTACRESSTVFVTLASSPSRLRAPLKVPDCGLFDLAPFVPGRSDHRWWSAIVDRGSGRG
ncbi:MAG TPA: DUF4232 domain-containing protein [Acidimicrobiales bacterium]|nr:DUF4232 domain-containing protein [Acidimicrobiales bacterium]